MTLSQGFSMRYRRRVDRRRKKSRTVQVKAQNLELACHRILWGREALTLPTGTTLRLPLGNLSTSIYRYGPNVCGWSLFGPLDVLAAIPCTPMHATKDTTTGRARRWHNKSPVGTISHILKRFYIAHIVDDSEPCFAGRHLRIDIVIPSGELQDAQISACQSRGLLISGTFADTKQRFISVTGVLTLIDSLLLKQQRRSKARTTLVQTKCPLVSAATN